MDQPESLRPKSSHPKPFQPRTPAEHKIVLVLAGVVDPCSIATGVPINIVDMGLIRSVALTDASVVIGMRLTNPFCFQIGLICDQIEKGIEAELGLPTHFDVDPCEPWSPDMMAEPARLRLRAVRPSDPTVQ